MIAIVWRYRVAPEARQAFEDAYGPKGAWAQLFGQAFGYVRTELLRGGEGAYTTLDYWADWLSFEAFEDAFAEDYGRLDAECEALTLGEERVGVFEVVG